MLHKDGKRAGALWWSDHVSNLTPIKSMYIGSTLVWDAGGDRPVVQITLGTRNEARDQLRAALVDRGLDYQTVTELPFDIELVGTGSAQNMFHSCSALMSVPDMDTAQVTSMSTMFYNCQTLTSAPDMDTAQVTDMRNMFQACSSLSYVPDMDTAQVTVVNYMFDGCPSLADGNVRLIGRHPNVSSTLMTRNSGLTREPFFDTDGNPI